MAAAVSPHTETFRSHDLDLDSFKLIVKGQLVRGGTITMTATATQHSEDLFRPVLNVKELVKASGYRRPNDQSMSTVAHGLKRVALTVALGVGTDKLRFSASDLGKPVCLNDSITRFSLSHAKGKIAVTLGEHRNVGVDIDFPRSDKYRDIAPMVLSPLEQSLFEQSGFCNEFFIRRWTQKEAISKASGLGLSAEFSRFTTNDQARPILCPKSGKHFYVETIAVNGGYLSVASEGEKPGNLIIDFDPFVAAKTIFNQIEQI